MVVITNDIKSIFEKSSIAFSTVDKNSSPNTIVVADCKVVSDNQVLITDNFMNKTRQNLDSNQRVSLTFWTSDENCQAFQFKGLASVFTDGDWKKIVDEDPANVGLAHKAAILVTITEIWDLADPKLICSE